MYTSQFIEFVVFYSLRTGLCIFFVHKWYTVTYYVL